MQIIPIHIGFINCFALHEEQTLLVDTGVAGSEKAILHKLEAHGILPGDISLILITHGHTDHFGGAAALHDITGAPVAVHAGDAEYVRTGSNPPVTTTSAVSKFVKMFIDERAAKQIEPYEPDVELYDGMNLGDYGVDVSIAHTPGHTPGSVSLLLPGNKAIIADLLMGRMVNMRAPRWPFFADSLETVSVSLATLLTRGIEKFYASHGGPFSRRAIERLIKSS